MNDLKNKAKQLSRRDFLKALLTGSLALSGVAAGDSALRSPPAGKESPSPSNDVGSRGSGAGAYSGSHGEFGAVGKVDHQANGFNPTDMLHDWDYGQVSVMPTGQTLREYEIFAVDKDIEIAPGVNFPAWTYNGRVPGPSLRCVEGDRIRIHFVNGGSHPHTIHFHGIHSARMDGVPGVGMA